MAKKNQNEALVKALLSLTAPKIDNSKMVNQLRGFPQGMGSKQGVYNLPADYNVKNEIKDAALFANSFAPVTGDIQSGVTAAQDASKGNYGMAALNAIGLLPFVPSMGAAIKNVGKSAKTKFELAHDLAQQRAALPVAEGGLGLPASNTAMDRAKALGFDTDVYHGGKSNIKSPDYKYSGKGHDQYGSAALYTATSPHNAGGYVPYENGMPVEGGNIMPLKINSTNFLDADKIQALSPSQIKSIINKSPDEYALSNFGDVDYEGKEKVLRQAINAYRDIGDGSVLSQLNMLNNDFYTGSPEAFNKAAQEATGYKGVTVDIGSGEKFLMPWETSNVRSRFAAFDPFRRNEADILAGVGVGLPVSSGLLNTQDKKKK